MAWLHLAHQFAAFIASEALLVVWDDEALHLVERAKEIESQLMELVWSAGEKDDDGDEKKGPNVTNYDVDEESGEVVVSNRPIHLENTVLVALTLILICATLGAGARQLAIETAVDFYYPRLALLLLIPVQIFFTLFFAQVIVGCLSQLLGPVKQLTINSKFYSARPPPRLQSAVLPHVTIQCPVYKEGLNSVIIPTVKSIKQAISTYELQGGSANMFINDDGLQIIPEEERRARIEFYADHSIGWVARPKHGDNFVRRGKVRNLDLDRYSILNEPKLTSETVQKGMQSRPQASTQGQVPFFNWLSCYQTDSKFIGLILEPRHIKGVDQRPACTLLTKNTLPRHRT